MQNTMTKIDISLRGRFKICLLEYNYASLRKTWIYHEATFLVFDYLHFIWKFWIYCSLGHVTKWNLMNFTIIPLLLFWIKLIYMTHPQWDWCTIYGRFHFAFSYTWICLPSVYPCCGFCDIFVLVSENILICILFFVSCYQYFSLFSFDFVFFMPKNKQTNKQTNKQSNNQTNKQTFIQTDPQTNLLTNDYTNNNFIERFVQPLKWDWSDTAAKQLGDDHPRTFLLFIFFAQKFQEWCFTCYFMLW